MRKFWIQPTAEWPVMLIAFLFFCYLTHCSCEGYIIRLNRADNKKTLARFRCDYISRIAPYYVCVKGNRSISTRDAIATARHCPSILGLKLDSKSVRSLRFLLNDPDIWKQQIITGQLPFVKYSKPARYTHNLWTLWDQGITGKGVVVAVVDDGVDTNHPDLQGNLDMTASFNYVDNTPNPHTSTEAHGTRCIGLIGAIANNSRCGVGVAYGSRVGAIRIMSGTVGELYDSTEALAFNHQLNYISIYSMSWGPVDDGIGIGLPHELSRRALQIGARQGRNGLGSVYIFSSGNGGRSSDSCSYDGYLQRPEVFVIGSSGQQGEMPPYAERCPALLASTVSNSFSSEDSKVYTTGTNGMCGRFHAGTSVSAPLAAGMLAMVLQINPQLTRRDIQDLIVRYSNQIDPYPIVNAAGNKYSVNFGYGLFDVHAMIQQARVVPFVHIGDQTTCRSPSFAVNERFVQQRNLISSIYISGCLGSTLPTSIIETVIVTLTISLPRRKALSAWITSPSGTRVPLLEPRLFDESPDGLRNWEIKVMAFYGEVISGLYTLELSVSETFGVLDSWSVAILGHYNPSVNLQKMHVETMASVCLHENIKDNPEFARACNNQGPLNSRSDFVDSYSFYDKHHSLGVPRRSKNFKTVLCFFIIILIIFLVGLFLHYLYKSATDSLHSSDDGQRLIEDDEEN